MDRISSCGDIAIRNIQDGGLSQLGFDVTGNTSIRSADPENSTLEPNMKCTDHPLRKYGHSRLGAYETPILGEGEVVGGQR